jgi:hypothetical protein
MPNAPPSIPDVQEEVKASEQPIPPQPDFADLESQLNALDIMGTNNQ